MRTKKQVRTFEKIVPKNKTTPRNKKREDNFGDNITKFEDMHKKGILAKYLDRKWHMK